MKIKFENRLMIVEHGSGRVDTYSKEYLQKIIVQDEKDLVEAKKNVDEIKNYITQIKLSAGG